MNRNILLLLAVAGAILLVALPVSEAAAEDGSAVLRCLHPMPGVACELAGVAVRPPIDGRMPGNEPHKRVIVASACGSTSGGGTTNTLTDDPAPDDYCGGRRPTPRLADGGILVLEQGSGSLAEQGMIPLRLGYGGAAWGLGNEVWQSVYSDSTVVRLAFDAGNPEQSAITQSFSAPEEGRVGGLAFDGEHLYVHQTDLDRIFVLRALDGAVLRSMPVPVPAAVNGLAFEDGRLYAAINDDNMSVGSTGYGPVQEAFVALDPESGQELARWNLPDGVDPHSMDRYGPGSLAVMLQTEPGPYAPMYLYELVLPARPASGMNNPVEVIPCE